MALSGACPECSAIAEHTSKLVAEAVKGDRVAIQRLLTRHHDRLVAMIGEKLPADLQGVLAPDDVCQEAYVSVYQQISSLRDHSLPAFNSWLQAVIERKLIDSIRALRARKRGGDMRRATGQPGQEVSSVVELLDLVAVHERTPSRSVARREVISVVQGALKQLKRDHCDVLRYRYIDGLSVAETAERMGRSAGAVVMLCNRALHQLAEQIGDPTDFLSRKA